MMDVERRKDAPDSLAAKNDWRGDDVLNALFEDFFGKCYLTEECFPSPAAMEVDHFRPKKEFEEFKYEWTCFPHPTTLTKGGRGSGPREGSWMLRMVRQRLRVVFASS